MRGITRDTLAEMFDRKVIWLFIGLTVIAMLVIAASRSLSVNIQANGMDLNSAKDQVTEIAMGSLAAFVSLLIFIAVMASASAIPHMLERGRADYYLSKPVSRRTLFLSKLASVWAVYGGVIVVACIAVFGTVSIVHGFFDGRVFLLLAIAALEYLVWLSITFAAGILTGSTSMAIVSAFMIWIFQMILSGREGIKMFFNSPWASRIVDTLYYIMPKTGEMGEVGLNLATGQPIASWVSIWTSLLFGVVIVIGALIHFARKDY